jgi:integrase
MPRRAEGARLYRRPDTGIYFIRDTGRPERSTGTNDRQSAEKALAAYIASKDTVQGTRQPHEITVAEALAIYGREHGDRVNDAARLGHAMTALLGFFGPLKVSNIKGETCRRYCRNRVRKTSSGQQPISDGTTRRELGVLQAALNHCHREGYLLNPPKVTLPEKPPAKERWLSRDGVAKLVWSAYRSRSGKHLARFILMSVYTGTRKNAVLALSFEKQAGRGWIDVEQGVVHRRGREERETKKRRKPIRMIRRLRAHCQRWRRSGSKWLVAIDGQRVGDIGNAFEGACRRAGLTDVTPHTLKHTAITWAIQKGLSVEDAADYFDTSAETIRKVYCHHSPAYQDRAVAILERKL